MKPKYILEVKVPSPLEVPIILREKEGKDVYEKGRELEQLLQNLFPGLEIKLSRFETREGRGHFYEMKMKCSPENAKRFSWMIKRVSREILSPEETIIGSKEEIEEIKRAVAQLQEEEEKDE